MWLAVLVGWLAQLALVELLPLLAAVGGRIAAGEGSDSWAEHTRDANEFGWFVVQGVIMFASGLAGALAACLAPRKPLLACGLLVALSLAASFFQQLPSPRGADVVALWALGPCVGLIAGFAACWRWRRVAV